MPRIGRIVVIRKQSFIFTTEKGRHSFTCRCDYGRHTYLLIKSTISSHSIPPVVVYIFLGLTRSSSLSMSALNLLLYLQHTHPKRTISPQTLNTPSKSQHVIPNPLPQSYQDPPDNPIPSQRIPHPRQSHCYDGESCHKTRSIAIPRSILPRNRPVRRGS